VNTSSELLFLDINIVLASELPIDLFEDVGPKILSKCAGCTKVYIDSLLSKTIDTNREAD
jgi:hypothetical protein